MGPGDIFEGKYRVTRVLGRQATGVLLLAENVRAQQRVAIKCLPPGVHGSAGAARSAVSFQSEHVGRVIDVGKTRAGGPFIVREYLDGVDVREYADGTPLTVNKSADIAIQVCAALAEAHARGSVHGGLKPENILIRSEASSGPMVKVLDFGASVPRRERPAYMAPEQLRGEDIDDAADVWALGVILCELVTGRLPFTGDSAAEYTQGVLSRDPTVEAQGIGRVIRRCLRKQREDRYPSVAELSLALLPFATSGGQELASRVQEILDVGTGRVRLPVRSLARGTEAPAAVREGRLASGYVLLVGFALLALSLWLSAVW